MRRATSVVAGWAVACVLSVSPAGADIVYLASGRTVSVKSHRVVGDSIVLTLRSGGKITCARTLIDRIEPDEVPYPEPVSTPSTPSGTRRLDAQIPFRDIIETTAVAHDVDPRLIRAVIEVESAYEPLAVSSKGAMGLMQLMPATARQYGLDDPFDPRANIEAGTRHLRTLLDRYDLRLALAAYNAGAAAVERYGGVPPYPETRTYVAHVMARLPHD